jgi:uncharacterized protein YccT (UPF0319 family)
MYDLLVDMILPVITSPMKGANSISLNDTTHQLVIKREEQLNRPL